MKKKIVLGCIASQASGHNQPVPDGMVGTSLFLGKPVSWGCPESCCNTTILAGCVAIYEDVNPSLNNRWPTIWTISNYCLYQRVLPTLVIHSLSCWHCRTKKVDAFTSRLLDIHSKMLEMNKREVCLWTWSLICCIIVYWLIHSNGRTEARWTYFYDRIK